jgi:hypothetical protein
MVRSGVLLALSCVFACDDKGGKGGKGGKGDDGDVSITGPDVVVIDDSDDGLSVDVQGGTATGWELGLVWEEQGYDDETCDGGSTICHPLDADGGTLDWCSQNQGSEGCTGIPQLYFRQGDVSLMIKPSTGLGCWAWGDEADHWPDCDETSWDPSSY